MAIEADGVTLALLAASPIIGSFLGVVAMRLPQERGFVAGRSVCDACGHTLGPLELVPVASYLALRGRCRHCSAAIDPLHPLMEIGAFAVALSAVFVTNGWIAVASCLLGWVLLTLSAIDWRTGFLPDVLTLPLIAAGLGVAYAIDPASILDHVIGAAAGFISFALLATGYRRFRGRDGLGLGDAKLLAASGAWLSWIGLPSVILLAAISGLAFVLLLSLSGTKIVSTARIAFGPALALATWIVWLFGPLVPG